MNIEQRRQEISARSARDEEQGFNLFMENQTTKFMLSLVPPCNPPETIETLLKAAFKAGFGTGMGSTIGEMMGSLMNKDKGAH